MVVKRFFHDCFQVFKGDCFIIWLHTYQDMHDEKLCTHCDYTEGLDLSASKLILASIICEGNPISLMNLEEKGYRTL